MSVSESGATEPMPLSSAAPIPRNVPPHQTVGGHPMPVRPKFHLPPPGSSTGSGLAERHSAPPGMIEISLAASLPSCAKGTEASTVDPQSEEPDEKWLVRRDGKGSNHLS